MNIVKAAMIGLSLSALAGASTARSEPVTIVVGFAPGGTSFSIAEYLADALGTLIGEKVYVESRAGASGRLAAKYVRQQAAGSRTFLLLSSTSAPAIPPDYGLTYVAQVASYEYVFATRESNPSTLDAYFAAVATHDALRNVSSAGLGTMPHLIADKLFRERQLELKHIPFTGGSRPAVTNVMGGHVQAAVVPKPDVVALLEPDPKAPESIERVKVIASTGKGIEEEGWIGMLGSPGMKPIDVERWAELFRRASLAAEKRFEAQSFRRKWRTGTELQTLHEREYQRFQPALIRLNITFPN